MIPIIGSTRQAGCLLAILLMVMVSCCRALLWRTALGGGGKQRLQRQHGHVFRKTSIPRYFSIRSGEGDDENVVVEEYKSRSTNDPELSSKFFKGSEERKSRLDQALQVIGINPDELSSLAEFRGSAASRTYNSFIVPKSEGALAMAEQPQRAAVVANSISFLLREHRSHQEEWLRNHDRSLEEAEAMGRPRNPITLVLDDVRSAHNVGNILRFAEAARCEKVLLCGSMTPSPPNPKVLKTALGAAEYVPHEAIGSTLQAVQALQAAQIKVFAVETTSRSIPMWQVPFFPSSSSIGDQHEDSNNLAGHQQIAFVFGNELVGVAVPVLDLCDGIVSVPTHGIKNSLNIATCASVVTWEALRQWEFYKSTHEKDDSSQSK